MRVGVQKLKVVSFSVGDNVKIMKGSFKGLTGKVSIVYDGGEKVQVNTGFLSKPMLMDYHSSYLQKVEAR
jgi:transcription antitermination factor NusG